MTELDLQVASKWYLIVIPIVAIVVIAVFIALAISGQKASAVELSWFGFKLTVKTEGVSPLPALDPTLRDLDPD
jgi:hypothetical protein